MTAKIDLFAAAPSLMKDWQRTSIALGRYCQLRPDPHGTGEAPCLPDQRLRQLHQPPCHRCARAWRNRAADLPAAGLARKRRAISDRERARASAGPRALTRLSEGRGHASAYEDLKAHFTEEEQVKLTLTINIINAWNRIAVGFGLYADAAAIKSVARSAAA